MNCAPKNERPSFCEFSYSHSKVDAVAAEVPLLAGQQNSGVLKDSGSRCLQPIFTLKLRRGTRCVCHLLVNYIVLGLVLTLTLHIATFPPFLGSYPDAIVHSSCEIVVVLTDIVDLG